MRNLLALLAATTLVLLVAGWYCGWYSITTAPGADGHRKLNIDINTTKLGADLKKAEDSITTAIEGPGKATTPDKTEAPKEPNHDGDKKGGGTDAPAHAKL
jgi:hypothetical protein